MKRDSFFKAYMAYQMIRQNEEKKIQLLGLKDQMIEILKGHIEIPEEEVYDAIGAIKKLSGYLDIEIRKLYQEIDEL